MAFDKGKFAEITGLTHTEQAIWFLNGFWDDGLAAEAEKVWEITHLFLEVQLDRKVRYGKKIDEYKEESDLEEHRSHRLLEMMGETQTVMALRKRLNDLDIDNNHRMAITEFLLDRYKKNPQQVIESPQGDVDPKKLAAAQEACDASIEALSKAQDEAAAAKAALEASEAAAAASAVALAASEKAAAEAAASAESAAAAAAESSAAADVVRAAEAELQAAIDEITALEQAKADKVAKCQAVIDSDAGVVTKGRAASEKEQILAEDPLPLRKAKITQKAALKKVTKAKTIAEEKEAAANAKSAQANADKASADAAAAAAATAKVEADAAAAAAAVAKEAAEAAEAEAQKAAAEAQAQLEEIKKSSATPNGKIWWMERVMAEKKKFMR